MRRTVAMTVLAVLGGAGLCLADELTKSELRAIGEGRALYLKHCSACHGVDARGLATTNQEPVPDLSQICLRDRRFDRNHVAQHIAFGADTPTWATRSEGQMPVWRVVLRGPGGEETLASRKILLLTRYLEFAQADVPDVAPR